MQDIEGSFYRGARLINRNDEVCTHAIARALKLNAYAGQCERLLEDRGSEPHTLVALEVIRQGFSNLALRSPGSPTTAAFYNFCLTHAASIEALGFTDFKERLAYKPPEDRAAWVITNLNENTFKFLLQKFHSDYLTARGPLQERVNPTLEGLRAWAGKLIESSELPISQLELERRANFFTVKVVDPVTNLLDSYGSANVLLGNIKISVLTPPDELPQVVAHEFVHSIAGKTYIAARSVDAQAAPDQQGQESLIGRVGLAVAGRGIARHILDEKLTNYVAELILGHRPDLNAPQWQLLGVIFERIDPKVLLAAYFEDQSSLRDVGESRFPAWIGLMAELRQKFGSNVFNTLQRIADRRGEQAAIDWLRSC